MADRLFPLGDIEFTPVFNTVLKPSDPILVITSETRTSGSSPEEITYTFTFNKTVSGFTTDDITVTGGSKGLFTELIATTYTLVVSLDENSTEITVDVPAGAAISSTENPNQAAQLILAFDGTPQIKDTEDTVLYTEGDGAQIIDSELTITDQNSSSLESANIQITDGLAMGEDLLSFVDTGNITGSYDAATGLLTLTGTDTLENYKLALESITYTNTNEDNPDTSDRTISWSVNDGNASSLITTSTINITGTDDASIITATETGDVIEGDIGDVAVTATGSISISDVDDDDSPEFSDVFVTLGDNAYGSFELTSGIWTYTLDQSAVQSLDGGDTVDDIITFTASDLSTQTITITITGSDDASVITAIETGALAEGNIGDPTVTLTGSISISDVDGDDSPSFNNVVSMAGTYGHFELTSGIWTYTLDQTAIQDLDDGDTVDDTATFVATDGSTQLITVTITGTDDASIITATETGAVNEGNTGDTPVTATGSISIGDVDDEDSPSFLDVASTTGDNNKGTFELSSGTWTYTLDQSAVQDLDAGDTVNDIITFTATDGSTQLITVTITGADDAPIITATETGTVTEGNIGDAAITATGSISISDIDDNDNPTFNDVASMPGSNALGNFELSSGTWTYTLDQSAVQNLDAGDTVDDTTTYIATDGSTQLITVTITGTADASVVAGTFVGTVAEANIGDSAVTTTGTLSISDADNNDSPVFADVISTAGGNAYGYFELSSGTWTYTLDQTVVQGMDAGDAVTDSITYIASDGSSQVITVTITGTDDDPVITATETGAVTEGNIGDAAVTTTGTLSISDIDNDDSPSFADVTSTPGGSAYGNFVLNSGTWTYTLDQSSVQNLNNGDTVTDSITFSATDGSSQVITVTITGADDASVISGTYVGVVAEGNIGDATVTTTGTINISDADDGNNPGFANVASTVGDNGFGDFELNSGTWTYTLNQSAVQSLDNGDTASDTITYTASDGSSQVITVTITGTDDASVVTATETGAVTEGNVGDSAVTTTGSISINDVDGDDSPNFADVVSTAGANGYGDFELTSGTWTYTLNQSAVQNLDAGDMVTDTITFTATDSSTQVITVTITGTADSSVISGTLTGSVNEGDIGDSAVTTTGTIFISDPDADDSPTFSDSISTVGGNGYGSFVLTSGTWVYTLDQSTVQQLAVGASVTDSIIYTGSDGNSQVVTVTINGTNDYPGITVNEGTDTTLSSNESIDENDNSSIIFAASVLDIDTGDTHTFSLSGTDSVFFSVNSSTGQVTANGSGLNFENQASYNFKIVATDANGLSDEAGVFVTANNLDENPVLIVKDGANTNVTAVATIDENDSSTVLFTANATDEDAGDSLSFSLTGTHAAYFSINSSTGVVVAADDGLNFEMASTYNFSIKVNDDSTGTLTDIQAVTVTVNDLNEGPELILDFTTHDITNSANGASSVFAVDVDGDGDIDVLSASVIDHTVSWFENDGNEGFTAHQISNAAYGAISVYAVDLDGDGDIDVLNAGIGTNSTNWFENDGNQNFTTHNIVAADVNALSVFAIDVNNSDGHLDVLVASSDNNRIILYANNGSESFSSSIIDASASGASSVFAIDVNEDGYIDILSASKSTNIIRWYENEGSDSYVTHEITNSALGVDSVFALDVDGDGDIDVLAASESDSSIHWYENDGNENFTTHLITDSANAALSVFAQDIDGDGDIDILGASEGDDTIRWFENDGSENFTAHTIDSSADGANSVFALDVDSDGDIDILSASSLDDSIRWYENPLAAKVDEFDDTTVLFDADVSDEDSGDSHIFTIDGTDAAFFVINTGTGEVVAKSGGLDLSVQETYNFNIVVTDNGTGNLSSSQAVSVIAKDTTAPTLSPFTPLTNVSVNSDIVLTFSENIALGSAGTITLSNGPLVTDETITLDVVADAGRLTISGNQLTINPDIDFQHYESQYHVLVDAGAITDVAGNDHPGVSNPADVLFTTEVDPLSIVVFDLTNGATSNHSVRSFSNSIDYTIYIVIDSDSDTLVAPNFQSRWNGIENLGSGDQVILVGNDALISIKGSKGGEIDSATSLSLILDGYTMNGSNFGPEWKTTLGGFAAKLIGGDGKPALARKTDTMAETTKFNSHLWNVAGTPPSGLLPGFASLSNGGFLSVLPGSITGITIATGGA